MLKIETKDRKNGYELIVAFEGKGGDVAQQIASALYAIREQDENGAHLVAIALDMYLDMIGFKDEENDD